MTEPNLIWARAVVQRLVTVANDADRRLLTSAVDEVRSKLPCGYTRTPALAELGVLVTLFGASRPGRANGALSMHERLLVKRIAERVHQAISAA